MAYWSISGPADPSPGAPRGPNPSTPSNTWFGETPSRKNIDLDQMVKDLEWSIYQRDQGLGRFNDPQLTLDKSYLDNIKYIRSLNPDFTKPVKKASDLNDIANILLDIASYGSAFASLIPIPPVRAGGIIAGGASSFIGNAMRGNTQGAIGSLKRATRELNHYLGRSTAYRQGTKKGIRR